MLKKLLYKWFGLEDDVCLSCDLLRSQLEKCDAERKELLTRLLDKDKDNAPPVDISKLEPVTPHFVPWHVKRQMLEKEDRVRAQLLRDKEREIAESKLEPQIEKLETELGVKDA